jgi:hypothetical protein
MFMCESTVGKVIGDPNEFKNIKEEDRQRIYSNDTFGWQAAGAIAASGVYEHEMKGYQNRLYLSGLPYSPYGQLTKTSAEDIISRFSIGAIAAFDDHGPRLTLSDQQRPIQGQRLRVDWVKIIVVLGWICIFQLTALLALLALANKSIIRDDSYLASARLLSGVVDKIPKEDGRNLRMQDIIDHEALAGQKIKYHYRKINKELKEVDIVFEQEVDEEKRSKRSRTWDGKLWK